MTLFLIHQHVSWWHEIERKRWNSAFCITGTLCMCQPHIVTHGSLSAWARSHPRPIYNKVCLKLCSTEIMDKKKGKKISRLTLHNQNRSLERVNSDVNNINDPWTDLFSYPIHSRRKMSRKLEWDDRSICHGEHREKTQWSIYLSASTVVTRL